MRENDQKNLKKNVVNENGKLEAQEILLEEIKKNLLSKKLNPKMPGYGLLVEACYKHILLKCDNIDNIYLLLGRISVVPLDNNTGIGKENLFMKESLEEAGIKIGVFQFIRQVSEEVCKIHK